MPQSLTQNLLVYKHRPDLQRRGQVDGKTLATGSADDVLQAAVRPLADQSGGSGLGWSEPLDLKNLRCDDGTDCWIDTWRGYVARWMNDSAYG